MKLSQEDKEKLNELIDKINPYVVMSSKEVIEQIRKWIDEQVPFEILDNDAFICNDKIYLIPNQPPNKPIKVIIE